MTSIQENYITCDYNHADNRQIPLWYEFPKKKPTWCVYVDDTNILMTKSPNEVKHTISQYVDTLYLSYQHVGKIVRETTKKCTRYWLIPFNSIISNTILLSRVCISKF